MSTWAQRWREGRAREKTYRRKRQEAVATVEAYRKTIIELQEKAAVFSSAAITLLDYLAEAERKLAAIESERKP